MSPLIFPLMAQLDNAADSDSEERGFESLWAGQKIDEFRQKFVDFYLLLLHYSLTFVSIFGEVIGKKE